MWFILCLIGFHKREAYCNVTHWGKSERGHLHIRCAACKARLV